MFLPDRDKVSGVTCGLEFLPRGSLLFCTIESLDVSGDASFEGKVGGAKSGASSRSSCIRQRKHPSKLEEKVRPQSPRKNCRRLRLRLASIWEEKVNPSPHTFPVSHTTRLTSHGYTWTFSFRYTVKQLTLFSLGQIPSNPPKPSSQTTWRRLHLRRVMRSQHGRPRGPSRPPLE